MTILHHIAERIINRPLLLHPAKVSVLLDILSGRLPVDIEKIADASESPLFRRPPGSTRFVGEDVEIDERGRGSRLPYRRTSDGTAVISVLGSLVNRGAWLGSYSGMTSYEGLRHQLDRAAADSRVRNVILDIESPGGEAVGMTDVANAVGALAKRKEVVSVVNGMAASAAYALASQSTRIVTGDTAISGSIGVVLVHADYSRALEQAGVATTLIYAGKHKVDGNPFEPLPDSVAADLQAEVDGYYQQFVNLVTKGRKGMSSSSVRGTEARTYVGKTAVDAGLADEVGTFDKVLSELSRAARRTVSTGARSKAMSNNTTRAGDLDGDAVVVTEAAHLEALAAAKADANNAATETGIAAGSSAAYDRIRAVMESEDISDDRRQAALALALEATDMTVETIAKFVSSHGASASGVPPVSHRSPDVGPDAGPAPGSSADWSKITGSINARRSGARTMNSKH